MTFLFLDVMMFLLNCLDEINMYLFIVGEEKVDVEIGDIVNSIFYSEY
jgi:hypothetical protein